MVAILINNYSPGSAAFPLPMAILAIRLALRLDRAFSNTVSDAPFYFDVQFRPSHALAVDRKPTTLLDQQLYAY